MRYLMLAAMLAGVALTSCGATLSVQFTMPTQGVSAGTCANPTLATLAPGNPQAVVRWRMLGEPISAERETTLSAALGSSVRVAIPVPAGDYWVRAWAMNDGVAGCPDSISKAASTVLPWKAGGLR